MKLMGHSSVITTQMFYSQMQAYHYYRGLAKLLKNDDAPSMDDLRQFLRKQNVNDLVEILMNQAMDDEKLLSRLMMKLSRSDKKEVNLSAIRKKIAQDKKCPPK
jgi:hypothetical protein